MRCDVAAACGSNSAGMLGRQSVAPTLLKPTFPSGVRTLAAFRRHFSTCSHRLFFRAWPRVGQWSWTAHVAP